MKRIYAAVVSALAAFGLVIAVSTPAQASVSNCYVGGNTAARLSVSKWNSSYWYHGLLVYRWTYHMDMNSAGGYYAKYIRVDGVKQIGTNDIYDYWGDSSPHYIEGQWGHAFGGGDFYEWKYCRIFK
jgi:hypothetical protein